MNPELIEFSNQIRDLVNNCDRITESTVQSISLLNTDIERQEIKLNDFLKRINQKKQFNDNLIKAVNELEAFLALCDSIENDKLKIGVGPKGNIAEYIKKLEYLLSIEKYSWYSQLKIGQSKKNEPNIQVSFAKHQELIRKGENYIFFEFQNILKHNCNREQIKYFTQFLLEKFCQSSNTNETFIPSSTVQKLELICSWFLHREQMYELYDDTNQHCDINQKLKYESIRFKFAADLIRSYIQVSSIGLIKEKDGKLRFSIRKIVQSIAEQPSRLSGVVFSDGSDKSASRLSLNLEKFSPNNSSSSQINFRQEHRPAEMIEVFSENLDFSLKVLSHEKLLINSIFKSSSDSCNELVSKLTVLIMAEVKRECEIFFKNSLDFTKFTNISNNVVYSIIGLKLKIKNLIDSTSCIQTNDLASASSIIQFSIRINQIAAQILETFLTVIQTGYLNTFDVPNNASLHPYCEQICQTWSFIRQNEFVLKDSIALACSSTNSKKDALDPSDRWYLSKYYSLLIEKLDHFLIDCTIKSCESHKFNFISDMSSISFSVSNSFAKHLKSLKAFIFLVNNLTYVFDKIFDLELINDLKDINSMFEEVMKENIENNILNSLQVFKYLNVKWTKLMAENELTDSNHLSIKALVAKIPNSDKIRKKNEYLFYLKEVLLQSMCLVIPNKRINQIFRDKMFEYVNPILEWMDKNNELQLLYNNLNLRSKKTGRNIIQVLYDSVFPFDSTEQLSKFL